MKKILLLIIIFTSVYGQVKTIEDHTLYINNDNCDQYIKLKEIGQYSFKKLEADTHFKVIEIKDLDFHLSLRIAFQLYQKVSLKLEKCNFYNDLIITMDNIIPPDSVSYECDIEILNCNISDLVVSGNDAAKLHIEKCKINICLLAYNGIKKYLFENSHIKKGFLRHRKHDSIIKFFDCTADYFHLENFSDNILGLDLTYVMLPPDSIINAIDLTYSKIKLVNLKGPYESILNIYELFLKRFKKTGSLLSEKLIDIEYKSFINKHAGFFGYIKHYISLLWWNYGYSKELIFLWTILLFIFFATVNYFLSYHYLNNRIYVLKDFPGQIKRTRDKIWFASVYTAVIFFGLKFDIDKIHLDIYSSRGTRFALIWLSIIYVSGLLCLAYLVNFIIQK